MIHPTAEVSERVNWKCFPSCAIFATFNPLTDPMPSNCPALAPYMLPLSAKSI